MASARITNGPVKDELVSRLLSNLPVTFQTSSGPVEVLIEEAQEGDANSDRISWHGRLVAGFGTGVHVHGHYDCLSRTGTLSVVVGRA
jgi:hypothetical protein